MTQARKSRKAALGICAVLVVGLVAGAGEVSPASSLSLPLETPTVPVKTPTVPVKVPSVPTPTVSVKTPTVSVKTPTVSVKTPTVSVKTPTVSVKVPTVSVKTPTVSVKTPTVSVKVPTVSVKVPTVSVKTPTVSVKVPTATVKTTTAKAPSLPVKSPSISIKAPSVSVKTPTVDVKTPAGSVRTTTGSVSSPSVSVGVRTGSGLAPSVTTSATSHRGATAGTPAAGASSGSAGSGSAGGTMGSGASPIGAYVSPGAGYGELPPFERSLSHRARARIVHRERTLKAIVARFHGCLAALASTQRELLELRTGYGTKSPLSPRATAVRLHLDPAQIGGLEEQAVRELHKAARTHSCAMTGEVVNGVLAFIGTNFGDGQGVAKGAVKAVRYESPATTLPAPPAESTLGTILGTNISATASDVLLALLALMGLGTIVAVVLADAAGQGPRHEAWRQRVINRIRSLR
jgi:hypothetical protein